MGLAILRRLAELMSGRVGVTSSSVNVGSTFWLELELPLAPAAESAQPNPISGRDISMQRSGDYSRVLLVGGDAATLRATEHILQSLGRQVDIACDLNATLHLLHRDRYALILIDFQILKGNGFLAVSSIREHELCTGRARTPIVALAANAMPGDCEHCMESEIDDYLPKPLLPEMLKRWTGPQYDNSSSPKA